MALRLFRAETYPIHDITAPDNSVNETKAMTNFERTLSDLEMPFFKLDSIAARL